MIIGRKRRTWRLLTIVLIVVVAAGIGSAAAQPSIARWQATPCRGPDERSDLVIWILQQAAAETDSDLVADWEGMGFLPVGAADIDLITDTTVCAAVVQAYNATTDLNPPADPQVDSLYVIRVGPRYDASDPAVRVGEFIVHRIFDTTFAHIGTHVR